MQHSSSEAALGAGAELPQRAAEIPLNPLPCALHHPTTPRSAHNCCVLAQLHMVWGLGEEASLCSV